MDDQKQQIAAKLKDAKNVLITVSTNPSVDQLAACIALTLLLNKLDKHATAVYSGETPSTIEFLQPDDTLEKNTDSLRDFIISLDKSKADKLRYKVEEKVVKIFITPYKTSLSGDDLEFSQGDFNVDVVVALGIHRQQDFDNAITAHGRILHDATIVTINNTPNDELGSIHWQDLSASSLSELVASLAHELGSNVLDGQIATALLTGIVAETQRFRNDKTTPRTMSISAELMAAGANQQLVAEQLDASSSAATPAASAVATPVATVTDDAGTLEINHPDAAAEENKDDIVVVPPIEDQPVPAEAPAAPLPPVNLPAPATEPPPPGSGQLIGASKASGESSELVGRNGPRVMTEAPSMGGMLTANSRPEELEAALDPLGPKLTDAPLLSRAAPLNETPPPAFVPPVIAAQPLDSFEPTMTPETPKPAGPKSFDGETLTEIEQTVHHQAPVEATIQAEASDLNSARAAVENAINAAGTPEDPARPLEPVSNLGWQGQLDVQTQPLPAALPPLAPLAQPIAPQFSNNTPVSANPLMPTINEAAPLGGSPADQPLTMPLPPTINIPTANPIPPTSSPTISPTTPPPVPPPMMPPGFGMPPHQ
jgi:hypothetical protein